VANDGAHLLYQLLGDLVLAAYRLSQFGMNLGPSALAGELDVPAIVIAAGAAARGGFGGGGGSRNYPSSQGARTYR